MWSKEKSKQAKRHHRLRDYVHYKLENKKNVIVNSTQEADYEIGR